MSHPGHPTDGVEQESRGTLRKATRSREAAEQQLGLLNPLIPEERPYSPRPHGPDTQGVSSAQP